LAKTNVAVIVAASAVSELDLAVSLVDRSPTWYYVPKLLTPHNFPLPAALPAQLAGGGRRPPLSIESV